MSDAISALESYRQRSRAAAPVDAVAVLEEFATFLRRSYGPTPYSAMPSDRMQDATELIADILESHDLGTVASVLRSRRLSAPLRHWCLAILVDRLGGGEPLSEVLAWELNAHGRVEVSYRGVPLATLAELSANVYRTAYEDGRLIIETQVPPGFLFPDERTSYSWVGWQTVQPLRPTGEYAGYHLFGHRFAEGSYFRSELPLPAAYPTSTIVIRAEFQLDGRVHTSSLSLGYRGASHLARVRGMGWRVPGFTLRAGPRAISAEKPSRGERIRAELTLYAALLARGVRRNALRRNMKVIAVRALYWTTRSRFRAKNIWLMHDKMYTASDCGEYMYRYLRDGAPDVTAVYAINPDAAEADRLRTAEDDLVYPGTIKQALYYLNARVVLTTHPNPATTTGLTRFGEFLRDLNTAPVVCIQHGLSMQELGRSMHQGHAGIERYYCASKYEIENIGQLEYGYRPDQLILTGIPRFDGLSRDSDPVILLSPTWRPEYAAPSPGENNRRPAHEAFLDSLYFVRFSRILTDRRLLEAAHRTGFSVRFMIHPTLATNHLQFRDGVREIAEAEGVGELYASVVTIAAAGIDATYDAELKRARLLVTDYSGIQYDFAYMRKAIVYFHPSDMPPQYGVGAMDYDSMGFGPVVGDSDRLVDALIESLRRGCAVPDEYEGRYETFFAFDDQGSRARIHRDLESWLARREGSR